ncbi:hypothetical protein BH09PAT2_BH09PAT2_06310 [soil metagenome]
MKSFKLGLFAIFIALLFLYFIPLSSSLFAQTTCPKKNIGDADCVADPGGRFINILDYSIWYSEFINNCSSTNLAGCGADSDHDGSAMDANFNFPGTNYISTDNKVDVFDYAVWIQGFLAQNNQTVTPTTIISTTPHISQTPQPTASVNTTSTISMRHPYQHNAQPALDYENFDITYWINNWDVQPNGKNVRLLIEKMNTKTIQVDDLGTTYDQYKATGAKTYPATTCDTPAQTVIDKHYYSANRIPVTGLQEKGFYQLTVELSNADNSLTGIKSSLCVEINQELLSSLAHVNDTDGSKLDTQDPSPLYLNDMKQEISQLKAQGTTIPPCPNHDPTKWHAIYDPIRKCHYDHDHGDDPNRSYYDNPVNVGYDGSNRHMGDALSVFGPAWGWIAPKDKALLSTTQTISYPWQTWSGTDIGATPTAGKMENDLKHNGYAWMVRTPDDFGKGIANCAPFGPQTPDYLDSCITHLRYEVHAVAGMPDALTHTHSFFLEARICSMAGNADGKDASKCGIYRGGGHISFGRLEENRTTINSLSGAEFVPFFYTDGPSKVEDLNHNGMLEDFEHFYLRNDGSPSMGGNRAHGAMAMDDVRANARDFTWYPESRFSVIAVGGTSYGPLIYTPNGVKYDTSTYHLQGPEYSQIRRQVYYCDDPTRCRWPNGSQMEAHFVIITTPKSWDGQTYDEDHLKNGYFTFHGYTNRYGDLLTSGQCNNKPLGADCVPTEYTHVPVTDLQAQHRDGTRGTPEFNYDIAPAGEYWVQFPN